MRDVLLDAANAVRQAKEAGARALEPERVQGFVDRYWQAVREGLAFHRALPAFDPSPGSKKRKKQRPGHNLLIRFKTFKDETLRFLVDFDVPFTNNLAEQDLRMTKVKMKISGGFRTFEGAHVFVRLRSIVSTARKQPQHPQRPHCKPLPTPPRNRSLKPDGLGVTPKPPGLELVETTIP